jgi:transposase
VEVHDAKSAMQPRMSAFRRYSSEPGRAFRPEKNKTHKNTGKEPKKMEASKPRVVGLDMHPDSFAGAILEGGSDPRRARVVNTSRRVALPELEKWAKRYCQPNDILVMEASGNSFAVAERLRAIGHQVVVLESHHAGKVGKTYCATDRVDAIKIARIYLSALSPIVWQPDPKTRERREVFSAYQAVVKESTRLKQQIKGMLNEHCVRLEKGFRLSHPSALSQLLKRRDWTIAQQMLLGQLHGALVASRIRRQQLRRYMATEVLNDPQLLRLTRLIGINLITLYGLIAAIGDIRRFASPRKLSAYFGLNPSVDQSGNYEGEGELKRHGKGAIRALLVQSAKKLLQVNNPLQKWGLAVAMRRGRNRAAVAVARKLCVAVWHVLQGHVIGALERIDTLHTKLHKLATELGVPTIKQLGFETKESFVQKKLYLLRSYP